MSGQLVCAFNPPTVFQANGGLASMRPIVDSEGFCSKWEK